jgi:hypothetical protein
VEGYSARCRCGSGGGAEGWSVRAQGVEERRREKAEEWRREKAEEWWRDIARGGGVEVEGREEGRTAPTPTRR